MFKGVTLKFSGLDADRHVVGARHLGNSLVGLDKTVNVGMMVLTTGRPPKRNDRYEFFVAARAPERGSVEITTEFQDVAWVLPLIHDFVVSHGAAFVKQFISWVLTWHGGRKAESLEHMQKMIEMMTEMNRSHEVMSAQWQETMLSVIDKLHAPAKQLVEPIGRSAGLLTIGGGRGGPTVIDEPMADAIRSSDELEVKDMQEMVVRVDGVIKHSRQLKVELPSEPGRFFNAEVRDPVFDNPVNPYADALTGGQIRVMVKPVLKGGLLHKLYVMDYLGLAGE